MASHILGSLGWQKLLMGVGNDSNDKMSMLGRFSRTPRGEVTAVPWGEEVATVATVTVEVTDRASQTQRYAVEETQPFVETVNRYAREAGLRSYRVIADGEEILRPSDAPQTFEGLELVRILPYDKAGR